MQPIVIALLGAGSRSFGPETVRDVLLSEALGPRRVELRLMDIVADNLWDIGRYAKSLVEKLGRNAEVSTTIALETALERAQFIVTAVEVGRNLYWAQDYHIPRKYGFRQVFAETRCTKSATRSRRCRRHDASGSVTACGWEWSRSPTFSTSPCTRWRWRRAASITSAGSRPSATAAPATIFIRGCTRRSAKAAGSRTGTRSAWGASCCGGSGFILRRRAITSANILVGRTSSAPTSWTGSTTRRTELPGKRAKCRTTCPCRMLSAPIARSRSNNTSRSG